MMIRMSIRFLFSTRIPKRLVSAALRASLCVFALAAFMPAAQAKSYFNMRESFSADIAAFTKWTGMMSRFTDQKTLPDAQCDRAPFFPCAGVTQWREMLERVRSEPMNVKLARINDFGNEHPYMVDQVNWGKEDYWETPYEFLTVNGDCEDYAIVKYYSLRAAGMPASKLRIIIVQDFNLGGVIHAVLGVYEGKALYILDNQIKQVMEAKRIYHYKPIYGINEEGWWAYQPI